MSSDTMATILVVDDSSVVLTTTTMLFKKSCPTFTVVCANNGADALHLAVERRPDVVLLDYWMPGMDGMAVCKALKNGEKTRFIPVVMMTGDRNMDGGLGPALEVGADAYLYKPFCTQELVALVKAMLRIKRTEDTLRMHQAKLERQVEHQAEELRLSRDLLDAKGDMLGDALQQETRDLIQRDRLVLMGVLSASVAHEINNPATFISANLQTFRMYWRCVETALAESTDPALAANPQLTTVRAEMPGLVAGMEGGVQRIAAIVSEIKSYATQKVEEYQSVQLHTAVQSAIQLTISQIRHQAEVVVDVQENLPAILGSSQMLSQVLTNLILNAANAMKDAGKQGRITIRGRLLEEEKQIQLQVSDNGPGIAPENMKHLFDPFFTTRRHRGGTGLGLFVCYCIIRGHNGHLTVDSTLGEGATFTVTLPVAPTVESA